MGREHELLEAARNGNIVQVAKIVGYISKRNIGPLSSFRRSPSINHQDVNGYTALHHACLNGHLEIVRLLLENDSTPDISDIRGSTPLYLAAWAGHCEIVKMLLNYPRYQLNVNVQTSESETPLHCAAQHGHNAVLGTLLACGANPAIRNNNFQTALDLAAQFGRLQVVQKLLSTHPELLDAYREQQVGINYLSTSAYINEKLTIATKHIFSHTCLHLASRNGHKRVVETLLLAGVNVNIMTHAGTALHEAALCGKQSVVNILLKAGINVHAVNGNGQTALELLKDFPPHVTYGIVSMIKAVCDSDNNNNYNFGLLRSTSNSTILTQEADDETDYEQRDKGHTMPNMVYDRSSFRRKNHSNHTSPAAVFRSNKTFQANVNSPAINSLARQMKSTAGLYLAMKPIQTSESDNSDDNKPLRNIKPDLVNNIYLNTTSKLSRSKRAYEKLYLARTGSSNKNVTCHLAPSTPTTPYNSVDVYVKMNAPVTENVSQSKCIHNNEKVTVKPKPPMPSPRIINDYSDYANVPIDVVEDIHLSNTTDENNNNKKHSPTPEFPPPTVTEAEHTILEYIQPNTNSKSKRSSLRLSEGDEANLNNYLAQAQAIPDESRQSNISDNVEEFVDDNPFAGLFKGSTLNLNNDEKEEARNSMRLRSPSLVRSIVPIPPKRQTVNNDDFDEVQVWEEINSIFESIGNEFGTEAMTTTAKDRVKTTDETNKVKNNFYIRDPFDIQLRTSNNDAVTNWCHSPNTLIYGQILYKVSYLGSTVVKELHGTLSTRKSIKKLKRNKCEEEKPDAGLVKDCNKLTRILKENNQQKRFEVEIAISCSGVRFIDVGNKATISIHDIKNINCVCQDVENMRYFAYITMEKGIHYCHVFMVDNVELATEIILSLGQAFEVAYQLVLGNAENS